MLFGAIQIVAYALSRRDSEEVGVLGRLFSIDINALLATRTGRYIVETRRAISIIYLSLYGVPQGRHFINRRL